MPETQTTTSLGALIRAARKKIGGMTQGALGEQARIGGGNAGQAISDYERGVYIPEADRMAMIIATTKMDVAVAWRAWGEAQIRDDEVRAAYLAATSLDGATAPPRAGDPTDADRAVIEAAEGAAGAVRAEHAARQRGSRKAQ